MEKTEGRKRKAGGEAGFQLSAFPVSDDPQAWQTFGHEMNRRVPIITV
jgi:hypothetical protein